MQYSVMHSKRKGEIQYTVTDGQLVIFWQKTKQEKRIPLVNIEKIHLTSQQNIYSCKIKTKDNYTHKISNVYIDSEELRKKSYSYIEFLNELHEKVNAANRNVNFAAGSNWSFIGGILLTILAVTIIVISFETRTPIRAIIKGIIALVIGISLIVKGSKGSYNYNELPAKYLPGN